MCYGCYKKAKMAEKRKLFSTFAEKLSKLNYSKPKVVKKIIKNSLTNQEIEENANKSSGLKVAPESEDILIDSAIPSTSNHAKETNKDKSNSPVPSTSFEASSTRNTEKHTNLDNVDFFFENNILKAFIERGVHKQEKKFAMHDHLFYIKVTPKKDKFPLLIDIVGFLEEACNHILSELKDLYKIEENNIGYLTIFQEPMINGIK